MKESASLVNFKDKSQEYEAFLEEQRLLNSQAYAQQRFQNVKTKIYENRNPNVKNFLKDIRPDYKNSLEDMMKSEFNAFMDQSVARSANAVRAISEKAAAENNDAYQSVDNVFITQEADNEVAQIVKKDEEAESCFSRWKTS